MSDHVFISYSRTDQEYVDRLAVYLSEAALKPWIDHDTDYGDRWIKVTQQKVDTCKAFIVVVTPASGASEWVEREILQARRRQRPIFPLLLAGEPPFILAANQHFDVRDGSLPSESFVEQVRAADQLRSSPSQDLAAEGRVGVARVGIRMRTIFGVVVGLLVIGAALLVQTRPEASTDAEATGQTTTTANGVTGSEVADDDEAANTADEGQETTTTESDGSVDLPASTEPSAGESEPDFGALQVRRNLSTFIEVLGSPSTINTEDPKYQYVLFDHDEFVVQVASTPIGEVAEYLITACSPDFQPSFVVHSRENTSTGTPDSVTLNVTSLAEAGGTSPSMVSYGIGVNGLLYDFFEAEYGGSPAGYASSIWGVDDICGDRANIGDLSITGTDPLNDSTSESVTADALVQQWRTTAVINSYGVLSGSGPESSLIGFFR